MKLKCLKLLKASKSTITKKLLLGMFVNLLTDTSDLFYDGVVSSSFAVMCCTSEYWDCLLSVQVWFDNCLDVIKNSRVIEYL